MPPTVGSPDRPRCGECPPKSPEPVAVNVFLIDIRVPYWDVTILNDLEAVKE